VKPRAVVKLKGRRRLEAVDVERLEHGWVRATTIRYRVDYNEALDVGRRVPDRLVVRYFPGDEVLEVVELPAGRPLEAEPA
jgi:hypothetical protein